MNNIRHGFRHIVLLLIGCAALLSVQAASGAGESTAPYIYYYADTLNAIVVERADGADSRVIAPGAMPANSNVIDNLDWSPSGQWMAWMAGTYNWEGGVVWSTGWIARSDGSERLTLLDNVGWVIALKWSPTADLLFVAYREAANVNLKISIIDPNANKVISHTEYQLDSWIESFPSGWTTDGSGVYYVFYFGNTRFLGQLNIDNTTLNRIFTTDPYRPPFMMGLANGRLLNYERIYGQHPATKIVMRDLGTGRDVFIDRLPASTPDNQPSFSALWDPTMRYALIFVWSCADSQYCRYPYPPQTQVYRLDWEAGTLQFLASRIGVTADENSPTTGHYGSDLWSPDGHYAVLKDVRGRLIIIDMTTGQLLPSIGLPLNITGWAWVEQSKALILSSTAGRQLYRYDLTQKSITPLNVTISPYSWFSLAPDGRFVGLISRYRPDAPDMVDLKTRGKLRLEHHSLGSGAFVDYLWHPGSQWFMTGENMAGAGSGSGPSVVTIFNTARTVRRELSICAGIGSCTGFVPDRALPYLGA